MKYGRKLPGRGEWGASPTGGSLELENASLFLLLKSVSNFFIGMSMIKFSSPTAAMCVYTYRLHCPTKEENSNKATKKKKLKL